MPARHLKIGVDDRDRMFVVTPAQSLNQGPAGTGRKRSILVFARQEPGGKRRVGEQADVLVV